MMNKLEEYITSLIKDRNALFLRMEKYAKENNVPIMELAGIEVMLQFLRIQQPRKILEIGTAIGYSALRMADALPNTQIVSIEKDEERFLLAKENILLANKGEQITLIHGDALLTEEEVKKFAVFDALFLDAAKGQYKRFLEIYEPYLSEQGIVFTDNVLFKGLVSEGNIVHKNTRQLVKRIKTYNEWMMNHENYETVIIPVGDGLMISKKR